MIIVNADDWGRTRDETDVAAKCYEHGRISSATAMVFMEDSARAADVAKDIGIDIGLHLNLTQAFTAPGHDSQTTYQHNRVVGFLTRHKYSLVVYEPRLRAAFIETFRAQLQEFSRLYGRLPSHVDGHHHKHLCANVLLGDVIPRGEKVRRGFHFWPGEKGVANRFYRSMTDWLLTRRYRTTDYFFALSQCLDEQRLNRVLDLAKTETVELMTHPALQAEQARLLSNDYQRQMAGLQMGTYDML